MTKKIRSQLIKSAPHPRSSGDRARTGAFCHRLLHDEEEREGRKRERRHQREGEGEEEVNATSYRRWSESAASLSANPFSFPLGVEDREGAMARQSERQDEQGAVVSSPLSPFLNLSPLSPAERTLEDNQRNEARPHVSPLSLSSPPSALSTIWGLPPPHSVVSPSHLSSSSVLSPIASSEPPLSPTVPQLIPIKLRVKEENGRGTRAEERSKQEEHESKRVNAAPSITAGPGTKSSAKTDSLPLPDPLLERLRSQLSPKSQSGGPIGGREERHPPLPRPTPPRVSLSTETAARAKLTAKCYTEAAGKISSGREKERRAVLPSLTSPRHREAGPLSPLPSVKERKKGWRQKQSFFGESFLLRRGQQPTADTRSGTIGTLPACEEVDPECGLAPAEEPRSQAAAQEGDTRHGDTRASSLPLSFPFRGLRKGIGNSFFAKRLLLSTGFLSSLNLLAVSLIQQQSSQYRTKLLDTGCAATINLWLLFNYFLAPNIVLGLAAIGPPIFGLFSVDWTSRRLIRTTFLETCEIFVIGEIIFIVFWTVTAVAGPFMNYGLATCFNTGAYLELSVQLINVIIYCLAWKQINLFNLYRHHLELHYCTFGFKVAESGVRSKFPVCLPRWSCFLQRYQAKKEFRRKLVDAASLGQGEEVTKLVERGRKEFGADFILRMYRSPPSLWGYLGISNLNPLHAAAAYGHVEVMATLLQHGFEVNMLDRAEHSGLSLRNFYTWCIHYLFFFGWTRSKAIRYHGSAEICQSDVLASALHVAAANGQVAAVKWLIDHQADVNILSKGITAESCVPPLYWVDNVQVLKVLLCHGANLLYIPRAGSYMRLTVLQRAYLREQKALYRMLEEWGGDVALSPLHTAAAENDKKRIERILSFGLSPDTLGDQFPAASLRTPLHWAAIVGALDAIETLIKAGADVNARDVFGKTPLHWASRHSHASAMDLLLSAGANPNIRDNQGRTPLLLAAEVDDIFPAVVSQLLASGADIHATIEESGDTALHIALKLENRSTALSFIKYGGDLMRTNKEGKRPIDCTTSTELQFAVKKEAGARDVMISYAHSQREFALKVRKSLEDNNITTWMDSMDPSGIGAGAVWREEIARGIQNASVVLCILSKDYAKSEWCMKELAFAKQEGVPVVASLIEKMTIDDELQVYLYTRQIVHFDSCFLSPPPSKEREKEGGDKVSAMAIDEEEYAHRLCLLLDGLRDEIEKHRLEFWEDDASSEIEEPRVRRRSSISSCGTGDMTLLSGGSPVPSSLSIFISHGDCHPEFARQLQKEFRRQGCLCTIDSGSATADMKERIVAAKDNILSCTLFIVILSRESSRTVLVNDQLAFAEDKGKKLVPIILSNPKLDAGKLYTLSRSQLFHFAEGVGFSSSFQSLMDYVQQQAQEEESSCPSSRSSISSSSPFLSLGETKSRALSFSSLYSANAGRRKSSSRSSMTQGSSLSLNLIRRSILEGPEEREIENDKLTIRAVPGPEKEGPAEHEGKTGRAQLDDNQLEAMAEGYLGKELASVTRPEEAEVLAT